MEGVSKEDNEIYLELVPDNLTKCLRCSQNAKNIKIKLTKKSTPCLTFEVELVSIYLSLLNHSRWQNTSSYIWVKVKGI